MKKTFVIALVLVLALTMGIVALAQGLAEDEEAVIEEAVERVEEPVADEAAEPEEEPAVDEAAEPVEAEPAEPVETEPAEEAEEAEKTLVTNWDVFHHRIQTWYGGTDFVSNSGKVYTLPAEIAEKYGTTVEYELPSILIYESIGELDSTETIEVYYVGTDENGAVCRRSEIITIEIPAGEAVYRVLEEEDGWTCTGFGILAGSYGDLYTEVTGE